MKTHELKTSPEFFDPIRRGVKNFDIRLNDRDFQPGDLLILKEWDANTSQYTGREEKRIITYILTEDQHTGLAHGYVILSITFENKKNEIKSENYNY